MIMAAAPLPSLALVGRARRIGGRGWRAVPVVIRPPGEPRRPGAVMVPRGARPHPHNPDAIEGTPLEPTPEQIEAARARGCVFLPATEAQVQRLAMQRRIFRLGGRPHVATRDGGGFLETHATFAALAGGGHAPDRESVAVEEAGEAAAAADAVATLAIAAERRASGGGAARVVRHHRPAARQRPPWRGAKPGG
jgi:hypothetical protein